MIRTSSYSAWNLDLYKTYSISGDRGKCANYQGEYYPKLAPKMSFWKKWYDNIGKVSEEENTQYYIQEYYIQVLSKLDPEEIFNDLNYSVLLCYEQNTQFCHRHIVAAWFELLLGIEIPEIQVKDNIIEEVDRPDYIKNILEDVIRQNKNMRGFNSLRALYLFEKGEQLESYANDWEEKTGKCYDNLRQAACYFRSDADEEEANYNNQTKLSRNKKTN